jgi:hypothetical protein
MGLLVVMMMGGCGGSDSPDQIGGFTTPAADPPEAASAAVDAPQGDAATAVPTLTLALNAALDTSSGTVKAASITQAQLLNTAKTLVKTATIASGKAQFDLTGLAAGHYFIKVNGLSNLLVPTRIDNPAANLSQAVGKKLRSSVIGSLASPTYRIETFPSGQGLPKIVKYSDGTAATPQGWAYVIMKPGAGKLETRYLGTAALLTSHNHSGPHSFSSWMLGPSNHGKSSLNCQSCHGPSSTHPASHSSIKKDVGWCFKCHYGSGGPSGGFVKPTQ